MQLIIIGANRKKKYDLNSFSLKDKDYYLATIHRAENTNNIAILTAIIKSLIDLNESVILPLHPRTQQKINDSALRGVLAQQSNVKIIDPVSYLEMILLEKHAKAIITDSGGVQKEAYFAKVPCFTLRSETEWVETVESGWNVLVDPMNQSLKQVIEMYNVPSQHMMLYGDGNAAQKIVDQIELWFKSR